MKTNEDIQREAERMLALGRSYRDEQRQLALGPQVVPLPRVLVQFPASQVTTRHDFEPEPDAIHTHRRERHIDASIEHDELVYRLMERETETTGSGRIVREDLPAVVMVSHSGFDLLHTGYEMVEEDRLAELLAPYAERSETEEAPADDRTVAEVEEVLETNLLADSDRLRAKAEIVEFLEGRLEASAFIAHAIDRQCARESPRVRQTERQEMRLTVDEP